MTTWIIPTSIHWSSSHQSQIWTSFLWLLIFFSSFGKPCPWTVVLLCSCSWNLFLTNPRVFPHHASVPDAWWFLRFTLLIPIPRLRNLSVFLLPPLFEHSPGYWNRSALALSFSSCSTLFEVSDSWVLVLPPPSSWISASTWASLVQEHNPVLSSTWRIAFGLKEMAARKHQWIHDVQEMKKMVPLITCETSFSQNVQKLIFGVNKFDLNPGIQISSINQLRLCESLPRVSLLDFCLRKSSWLPLHCLQTCTTETYLEMNVRSRERCLHSTIVQHLGSPFTLFWTCFVIDPRLASVSTCLMSIVRGTKCFYHNTP